MIDLNRYGIFLETLTHSIFQRDSILQMIELFMLICFNGVILSMSVWFELEVKLWLKMKILRENSNSNLFDVKFHGNCYWNLNIILWIIWFDLICFKKEWMIHGNFVILIFLFSLFKTIEKSITDLIQFKACICTSGDPSNRQ